MSIWSTLTAWWHLLWHHAQAGTLPEPPKAGEAPVAIGPKDPNVYVVPTPAPEVPAHPAVVALPEGVTLVDATNGLVTIAAADAVYPGQKWCVVPLLASVDPNSQAYATVDYNTATAKLADAGFAMHMRVNTMVASHGGSAVAMFVNTVPYVWIDDAWTVGAEFDTWDKAIAHAVFMAGNLKKAAENPRNG